MKVTKPRCHKCGSTADVSYAPHAHTIPGAAHGGRWICASCLYLEDHPEAVRVRPPLRKPKVPQVETLW